jgi:hypothetical protein
MTLILVWITLLLSSCDIIYGVLRTAEISEPPELDCVKSVLVSTPGVDSVNYQESEGGRTFTVTGIKPPIKSHTFTYSGVKILASVQIMIESSAKTTFRHTLADINRKPPQDVIDRTLPLMRQIERQLEAECKMRGLPDSIKEYCFRIECQG